MYSHLLQALVLAALSGLSFPLALPQNPDPANPIPTNTTDPIYPAYTYTPSVDADYHPIGQGISIQNKNQTIQPQSATNTTSQSSTNSTVHTNALLTQASCTPLMPTNPGTFWYESIDHNGMASFMSDPGSYSVFRNVKDYGATGDGTTDDSGAIQAAIDAGNSATGQNRNSDSFGTTGGPAVIYFPEGKYLLANSIQLYVNTFLIGNPNDRPQLQASSSFNGGTMVFGKDPNFGSTNNFYIGMKNLILVSTAVSASTSFTLLDWSVSQATQLSNLKFDMPDSSQHTGLAMPEGGSGTMLGNLLFQGGLYGINMNNQQYLIKDTTFDGCNVGIYISHVFDLVIQNATFENCGTGIDATNGGQGNIGSVALIDSSASFVGTVINTKAESTGDDSIVIDNFVSSNSGSTVTAGGNSILSGSVSETWVYGNAYVPGGPNTGAHQSGTTYQTSRSGALLTNGKYITLPPPTYTEYSLDQVVNIKSVSSCAVMGDGQTDDTNCINTILSQYAGCAVIFFPAGTYIVTNTIQIPPGSRIIGEALSSISASGSNFKNVNAPIPMVQLGQSGDQGVGQISDMLFTVADLLPGCILLEVNMRGAALGDVGIWNSHFRVGGAVGSTVETSCQSAPCMAAFMMLHLTTTSSAYIEDMWAWTADHDLDGPLTLQNTQVSTGRGALIEATAGTWLVGTAIEHNTLYQYNLNSAENVVITMQQSETPYWQGPGSPDLAPAPWVANTQTYHDPDFSGCAGDDGLCRMAWFQRISGGSDIYIYGSGFWSFFNHNGGCSNGICQTNAAEVVSDTTSLFWYTFNTLQSQNMLINDGTVLVTQNNNPGSWGGIVAAMLADSSPTSTTPPTTSPTGSTGPQVTNSGAFSTGAGNNDNANIYDGTGNRGSDAYTCYYGGWQNFPSSSQWVEFDAMWNYSISAMQQGCGNLGISPEDTDEQIGEIYNAIQQVAINSLVDHRFILATIMQESIGCVYVGTSTDQDGDPNPGLMQSADGSSYNPSNSQGSITQMVIDGTQGTSSGDGLVQGINMFGNVYEAARYYNSGEVDENDLNNGEGATNSYVNDIACRLTGWVYASSTFDSC